MVAVADTQEVKGEVPDVWKGEQHLVDNLLERTGGEWVITAAFADYGSLTDTTRPIRNALLETRQMEDFEAVSTMNRAAAIEFSHRLSRDSDVIDEVDEEAGRIAELIPPSQREAVVSLGNEFLTATAGHIGVAKLIDAVEASVAPV